jgi:SAM-dependent methyltransferase
LGTVRRGSSGRRRLSTSSKFWFGGLTTIQRSSPVQMVAAESADLAAADLRVSCLHDSLPQGDFDLVESALAVHQLDGAGKADLFARVADRLQPGGRFVLATGWYPTIWSTL